LTRAYGIQREFAVIREKSWKLEFLLINFIQKSNNIPWKMILEYPTIRLSVYIILYIFLQTFSWDLDYSLHAG
jgi:hypothetical protein